MIDAALLAATRRCTVHRPNRPEPTEAELFAAIGEALFWLVALHDLMKGPKQVDLFPGRPDLNGFSEGRRWARNKVGHGKQVWRVSTHTHTADFNDPEVYFNDVECPFNLGQFRTAIWSPVEFDADKFDRSGRNAAGRSSFIDHCVDRRVIFTLHIVRHGLVGS